MIEIWTEELSGDWKWTPNKFCGGTIEFAVETARVLSKFEEVVVYYDGEPIEHNGVYYLPRSNFKGNDIVLSCNSHAPNKGKYNIYWTSWANQTQDKCLDYDERIVLSPYHQSIFGENSRIVPLGCWKDNFKDGKKARGFCLYSSSPDRGGFYLKSIWEEVFDKTGAVLISTYRSDISEEEMQDIYKKSQFWLHPGQGIELFCLSGLKAQVAGCIPIVVPNMALETTIKIGVKTTADKYKSDLIEAIKNPPEVEEFDCLSWVDVTKDLFKKTNIFSEVIA